MTELLPCPFCGGQARIFHFSSAIRDEVWRAVCDKPFCAQGPDGCTEAEAIAAWNSRAERGTLTVEQVREAIERNFGKVAVLDDGGPVEWRDDWVCNIRINYKAIADELNARAERTCRIVEYDEAPFPVCSECGAVQPDDYTVYYCWNCGAKVVGE